MMEQDYRPATDKILELLCKNTKRNPSTHCWDYQNVNMDGYGQISLNGVFLYVHRLAANLFFGFDLRSKYLIQHKCNNASCWFPEHIISGTDATNQLQRSQEQFHCKWGHEFTLENTYFQKHGNKRQCKKCKARREFERRRRLNPTLN